MLIFPVPLPPPCCSNLFFLAASLAPGCRVIHIHAKNPKLVYARGLQKHQRRLRFDSPERKQQNNSIIRPTVLLHRNVLLGLRVQRSARSLVLPQRPRARGEEDEEAPRAWFAPVTARLPTTVIVAVIRRHCMFQKDGFRGMARVFSRQRFFTSSSKCFISRKLE